MTVLLLLILSGVVSGQNTDRCTSVEVSYTTAPENPRFCGAFNPSELSIELLFDKEPIPTNIRWTATNGKTYVGNPVSVSEPGEYQILMDIETNGVSCTKEYTVTVAEPSDPYGFDTDEDGICDEYDNCPATANPDQLDSDEDGTGDICDPVNDNPDTDGDGIPDREEDINGDGNLDNDDTDNDDTPNYLDPNDEDPCNLATLALCPANPVICENESVPITAAQSYTEYRWRKMPEGQLLSTSPKLTTNKFGLIEVRATSPQGCEVVETFTVSSALDESAVEQTLLDNGYTLIPIEILQINDDPSTLTRSAGGSTKNITIDEADAEILYNGRSLFVKEMVEVLASVMSDENVGENFITNRLCSVNQLLALQSQKQSNISVFLIDQENSANDKIYVNISSEALIDQRLTIDMYQVYIDLSQSTKK